VDGAQWFFKRRISFLLKIKISCIYCFTGKYFRVCITVISPDHLPNFFLKALIASSIEALSVTAVDGLFEKL
jgi:hypothetical protein